MNVREASVEIVQRVQQGAYLNLTLNSYLERYDFSKPDAALLTRLVYSVYTHLLTLEYGMKEVLLEKKIKNYERAVLLVAYTQMVYFDKIPDYAIINESVALVKKKKGKHAAGFINALLHQLKNQSEIVIETEDEALKMSLMYSEPLWLVKMFTKQYGQQVAERIFQAYQEVPLLSARVNTLKTSLEAILQAYPQLKKGNLAQNSLIFPAGNIASHPLYAQGLVSVQDEASQLVAEFLGVQPGMMVLDMCAAPGSKTTHLSALMQNSGEIHAYDIHEHKIALIKKNAKRLGCENIVASAYDATCLDEVEAKESFDAILLDGPCSGLGVLSRKPEIRYHDPSIMDQLALTQQKLLETAVKLLKNGGTMVYSTCTLNKKENEKNIERLLENHPEMELVRQRTIFPFEYQSDGFYMAKMVKKDEKKHL